MAAFGSKKLNRAMVSLVVLLAVVIMFAVITATAWAVPELRRIETGNINKPTDIHAIGGSDSHDKKELGSEEEHGTEEESDEHKEDSDEHEKEDEHEDENEGAESDHEEDSHDAEEDDSAADHGEEDDHGGAVTEEHGEEDGGGEHGGEVHHPAWMIPGWQSIFAAIAVVYFGLALKFLPKIMAKEEGH